jgi:predicted alpha/beta superfamily hydrolase
VSYGRLLLALALASGCQPERLGAFAPDLGRNSDLSQPPGSSPDLAQPPGSSSDLGGSPGSPDLAGPTVTLIRIHYPAGGHSLTLRGDSAPLDWQKGVALTSSPDKTIWSYEVASPSGPVQFKPLLDDVTWAHGDNYTVQPGQTVEVYPHFVAQKGTVKQLFASFSSKIVTYNQIVWVYLPPSYDENTLARYPVLYMHDGQNLFDPTRAFGGNEWKVDETLDAAAEQQPAPTSIREIIVIGPEAGPDRMTLYTPTFDSTQGFGGDGDKYLRMLVEELKPQVDAMLRTQPEPEHTGILGSSLGGLISAYAGCTHAATFGLVGAMSPSTWWDNTVIIGDVKAMAQPRPLTVYVDSGDSGPSNDDVTDTANLASAYRGLGYSDGKTLDYLVQMGGQHNEVYWAQRFPGAAQFLFGKR